MHVACSHLRLAGTETVGTGLGNVSPLGASDAREKRRNTDVEKTSPLPIQGVWECGGKRHERWISLFFSSPSFGPQREEF